MEKLLTVNPGLLIWTLVNFLIFLFLLLKFGLKPTLNALKAREDGIRANIENAEAQNKKAQEIFQEAQNKLSETAKEVNSIIAKGRETANEIISSARVEADKVRQERLDNAVKEIKSAQEVAFNQLKQEVAGMVIQATEKILEEKLTPEKDFELINKYVEKLSKN